MKTKLLLAAVVVLVGSCKVRSLYERRLNERLVTEPSPWTEFVAVKGQALPVPKQWLADEEARKAHDLVLPQNLGQLMVPFDFEAARWKAWLPHGKSVGDQYLEHLCTYEAGEWVFKVTEPQEGIYIARTAEYMPDDGLYKVWDYEAPLLEKSWNVPQDVPEDAANRHVVFKDGPGSYIGWAGDDKKSHYRFVEIPNVGRIWQKKFEAPYLHLWGHHEMVINPTQIPEKSMQVKGIQKLTARYGITWRGLRRVEDREYRISGYEQMAYDLQTGVVIALRRQFARMMPHGGRPTFGAPDVCNRIYSGPNYQERTNRIAAISIRSVTGAKANLFVDAYPKEFQGGEK
ncbi:hypothetical protein [Mitsuaria sp. WAJ17]|uniref:hypothetical protein n=1 Tax=Mitsuaria sp. WAJ17 TaxID=2761452 RepID=UPI001603AB32|nr:hypothetical protein [Mitsuaria sp. WAJ17]